MMGFLREEGVRRYVEALEEERKKIQMFQRELPLCCELVTQAIESYKQQMMCEEETSNNVPVLEEFIPIKQAKSVEEEEGEEESSKGLKSCDDDDDDEKRQAEEKLDWLQSVQLWNQNPDPPKEEAKIGKPIVVEAKKVKGAFQPFHRDRKGTAPSVEEPTPTPTPPPPPPAASSTGESRGGGREKEGHSCRKPRRCWSPELHRRFLHALHQLGGSHAATPKQIRELMKVDGLTNDEVKSHLQKYRLHTRRPSQSGPASNGGGGGGRAQTPQLVLVGGIWVPSPPDCVARPVTERSASPTCGVYAPVASVPARSKCNVSNSSSSNNGGEGDPAASSSPATSSSSLTITATPRS